MTARCGACDACRLAASGVSAGACVARITTRAGRKIRHVAPGHVVDVATGIEIRGEGPFPQWAVQIPDARTDFRGELLDVLSAIDEAAGICALVRWLGELGQAVRPPRLCVGCDFAAPCQSVACPRV